MPYTLHPHPTPEALAEAVAALLATQVDAALARHGKAVLALAGGRTSPPVFRRLAAQARDWTRVSVIPTDERWVAADHPDCNLTQMKAAFANAKGLHYVGLAPPRPSGPPSAGYANAALSGYPQRYDATLLGMGLDGHFGSLFPGAPNLAQALALDQRLAAMPIIPDPLPDAGPHPRVSLTLARMLRTRALILAITGADKRAVLARAADETDATLLPVAALLNAPGVTVDVHWSPS